MLSHIFCTKLMIPLCVRACVRLHIVLCAHSAINVRYYLHLYNCRCHSSSHLASEREEEATRVLETLAAFLTPSSSRLPLP